MSWSVGFFRNPYLLPVVLPAFPWEGVHCETHFSQPVQMWVSANPMGTSTLPSGSHWGNCLYLCGLQDINLPGKSWEGLFWLHLSSSVLTVNDCSKTGAKSHLSPQVSWQDVFSMCYITWYFLQGFLSVEGMLQDWISKCSFAGVLQWKKRANGINPFAVSINTFL